MVLLFLNLAVEAVLIVLLFGKAFAFSFWVMNVSDGEASGVQILGMLKGSVIFSRFFKS